ncbi:MAG: WbqC family protein [Isosphaeraceae bacterium]|nr:WbqC family protein [Isosphaeraceae bacterium]
MNCVILQPSYIPWRGYFDLIQRADVFVFYDDVQYDKHGWRNRNRVKTAGGTKWLTIPVRSGGNVVEGTPIRAIEIDSTQNWARKHWETIRQSYAKAPYFGRYRSMVEEFYAATPPLLADFTIETTVALARALGIEHTRFVRSSDLPATGAKTDRLVDLLTHLGATHYISGPSARDYMEDAKLAAAGITLEYIVYEYPEYPQLYPPFAPQVSVIDLLLMTGPDAPRFVWDRAAVAPAEDRRP